MYYSSRAKLYDDQESYSEAIADYDRSIELNSSNAVVYNNRGVTYYSMGDYDKACLLYTSRCV